MCKGPHLLPEMCFPLALEPEVLKQGVSRALLPWRLEGGSFTSSSLLRRPGLLGKKDLHDPDNHDGVITHLQPDILECEVKWALGSYKQS